jgi:putative membrane protein
MKLGLMLRGLAMGIAEVVPGVSGGTIAFVTGIYDELLRTLAGLDLGLLRVWREQGFGPMWGQYNLQFLLWLGCGMVGGVLVFAKLMHYALDTAPPVVWALFFGLIVFSIVDMARALPLRLLLPFGLLGTAIGLLVANLVPAPIEPNLLMIAGGGALAVSAWLLPAVSGSFLLLVLGLYDTVLLAISELQVDVLLALIAGCGLGLLLFSRFLHWLMSNYRQPVISLLVGFMLGSLVKLWPWTIDGSPMLPAAYSAQLGEPAWLIPSLVSMIFGVLIIWGLARIKT